MFAHGSGKATKPCTPLWVVERLTEDGRWTTQRGAFNLTCEDKELSAVTVGASGGGSISATFIVVGPIMTNAVDVKKGEELFLEITRKKETKRKEGSWKDDVDKPKNAKPPTAPSLQLATEI